MKKALMAIGMVLAVAACVFGGVLAGARLGGGVPAGSFLADVPGVSRLVGTRQAGGDEEKGQKKTSEKTADSAEGRRMSYLEMAPRKALKDMVQDLEERVQEVNNREERLARRKEELKAWKKALKKKRKKLTSLAEKKKKQLTKLKKKIERQRQKLKDQKIAMSRRRQENLEKAANIYNRMDAARAAATHSRLYKQGKEDTVVQIVYLMKDRNAAEVLGAMQDEKVSVEITRKIAHVSQESE